MYKRLLAVVVLTLFLQPAAAASPVMDFPTMWEAPLESQFSDPDNLLDGAYQVLCTICNIPFSSCEHAFHAFSQPPRRPPTFTEETFYGHPDWPHDSPLMLPDPAPAQMPYADHETHRQLLIAETIQLLNDNATTVGPEAVQSHVEDTYLPGDHTIGQAAQGRRLAMRHAPRENGFACEHTGCGRLFNRNCDLNRHTKTHQASPNRRHKCSFDGCDQGFLYPKDKARHEKTHNSPAAPSVSFQCQVEDCSSPRSFSRRDNLLRHHRKQHPNVPIPVLA